MPDADAGRPASGLSPRTYLFASVCLLGAFAVRTASHFTLGELELDDASTFLVASRPLRDVVTMPMAFHSQPPLFYLTLHEWLRIGDSEAVLRILPLLFMLGAAVTLLAVGWLSRVTRLTATAVLLLTSFSRYLTTALRPYSLSVWLSLASCLLLIEIFAAPRRRWTYVVYLAVTVLMAYAVAPAVWVLVAEGTCVAVAVGLAAARVGPRAAVARHRALILTLAAVAVLVLPYVLVVWRLQGALRHPTLAAALAAALRPRNFVSGPLYLLALPSPLGYLAPALAACGVWFGVRRRDPVTGVLLAIVIIQISLTHGFLEGRTGFSFRYLAPAFAALCVLAGLGADGLLSRTSSTSPIVALGSLAILAAGLVGFVRAPRTPPVGVWRQVSADLQRLPGRKLVFFAVGWDSQRLRYEVRHDPDVQIMADAGTGWASGGQLMTPEYVTRTIDRHFDRHTMFFYQFDPVTDALVFDAAFAPAMARYGCRRVYQRDTPTYARDVAGDTGALLYGYACDGG